jgi:hypothetical protein
MGGVIPVAYNRLAMLTGYIAPDQHFIACPNQDVAYGAGFFDLDKQPAVFQVPDFGDRFWVMLSMTVALTSSRKSANSTALNPASISWSAQLKTRDPSRHHRRGALLHTLCIRSSTHLHGPPNWGSECAIFQTKCPNAVAIMANELVGIQRQGLVGHFLLNRSTEQGRAPDTDGFAGRAAIEQPLLFGRPKSMLFHVPPLSIPFPGHALLKPTEAFLRGARRLTRIAEPSIFPMPPTLGLMGCGRCGIVRLGHDGLGRLACITSMGGANIRCRPSSRREPVT